MRVFKLIFAFIGLFLAFSIRAKASDYVVYVGPPSGDDTAALQGALDVCVQHPTGCTVQLDAGTYKTRQLLASNFHGTLKGKGMDVTIIEALPDLYVNPNVWASFPDLQPPTLDQPWPSLVTFMDGDVTVADISLRVTEAEPTQPWSHYGQIVRELYALVTFTGEFSVNGSVERVSASGIPQPCIDVLPDCTNLSVGVFFFESGARADYYLNGTLRVVQSKTEGAWTGVQVSGMRDGSVIIGGSPANANKLESQAGVFTIDMSDCVIDISHNTLRALEKGWGGFVAWQQIARPNQEASRFFIHQNTIEAVGGFEDGVWLHEGGPSSQASKYVVANNTIHLSGSDTDPAFAALQDDGTVGTVFSNNRISGENALVGIITFGDNECMLKANNMQGLHALLIPILLVSSTDCTVVGGIGGVNATKVYDDGGTGNVFVGVNNQQGNPPGPAIKEAMKTKQDVLKSLRAW